VRVSWTPDSKKVVYQAQNREQTYLDLNFADAMDGKSTTAFRETTKAWVQVLDNPHWLKDGSFVWQSERSGYEHLYLYNANGKLVRQLTDGNWDLRWFEGIDEDKGYAYFNAIEHSPIATHAYRVKLDGTGFTRLTTTEGSHSVDFNPTFTAFVDKWSDINTPTQTRLFDADGKLIRVIEENKIEALKQYKLGTVEFMQVKTRDGFPMEAMMIKPPDFDPRKKYPVMSLEQATCGIRCWRRGVTSFGSVITGLRAARALSQRGRATETWVSWNCETSRTGLPG
jgi:dipeptidyl-peptidase-4